MSIDCQQVDGAVLAASRHKDAPLLSQTCIDNERYAGIAAGDFVGLNSIDWDALWPEFAADGRSFSQLRGLRGTFVLGVYDKLTGTLSVASDEFAMRPLYMCVAGNSVMFSTRLSSFHVMPKFCTALNEAWLFEHLFFNYAIGSTTMIRNVQRIPAATITSFNSGAATLKQVTYAERPAGDKTLMAGQDALAHAKQVFDGVVPNYITPDHTTSFGLSAGLDSRSVLAAVPDENLTRTEMFTYGIEGSTETDEVNELAAGIGIAHRNVPIDEQMLARLPSLMHQTVYLSDGLQNVNRAHLAEVYRLLDFGGCSPAAIVTGVSGDHLFRDHIQGWGNVPYLVSADCASLLRDGVTAAPLEKYANMLGDKFEAFAARINSVTAGLQDNYGQFPNPEAYLHYLIYEAGPRYFAGQAAIANAFSTFRTPFWDADMIRLCYEVEYGTLGFSRALDKKNKYRETVLQTSIVAASKRLRDIPYLGIPVQAFARDNELRYLPHLFARKFATLMKGGKYVPFENWKQWYQTVVHEEVNTLLGNDCRLAEYISPEFVQKTLSGNDVHWLGKLLTAEIALRLFENGWSLDSRHALH